MNEILKGSKALAICISSGATILSVVYVSSQLECAGVGRPWHINRRSYATKWKVVWFCFGRLREGQGVIWDVATALRGRQVMGDEETGAVFSQCSGGTNGGRTISPDSH